ncbi:MAG TPA: RnfABCDGE type electron transport complex subunit D [Thermomicrobiales bacterium]|nr:RnfABCDGE type electron transport complex subunit D [Thermomicrobiales bacterium]
MAVVTSARSRPAARRSVGHRFMRFARTPKGAMLLVLLLLTALAAPRAGLGRVGPGLLGAAIAAMLTELAFEAIAAGRWRFPDGALLTGLFVALILSPTAPWYVPVLTAMLAVAYKYALRTRWANIFNPAALALVAAYVLFAGGQSWWGALPDLPPAWFAVLAVTGLYIANRVNKLPLVLVFSGAYIALFTAVAFAGDPARVAEIFRVPDVNAAFFCACFMLTDPPTSPARYRDQIWFGLIAAVVSAAVFLELGGVYYLLAGVLAANAWETGRRWRRTGSRPLGAFGGRSATARTGTAGQSGRNTT